MRVMYEVSVLGCHVDLSLKPSLTIAARVNEHIDLIMETHSAQDLNFDLVITTLRTVLISRARNIHASLWVPELLFMSVHAK